jgi:hypothetical protein
MLGEVDKRFIAFLPVEAPEIELKATVDYLCNYIYLQWQADQSQVESDEKW